MSVFEPFQMIQLFRGCKAEDMPPHIYASAQSAYRSMQATRCDQSLVYVGRSGSGKTHNFRSALHYLCLAAGSPNKIITGIKGRANCRLDIVDQLLLCVLLWCHHAASLAALFCIRAI